MRVSVKNCRSCKREEDVISEVETTLKNKCGEKIIDVDDQAENVNCVLVVIQIPKTFENVSEINGGVLGLSKVDMCLSVIKNYKYWKVFVGMHGASHRKHNRKNLMDHFSTLIIVNYILFNKPVDEYLTG
ncbi:hypothetical protein DMUE_4417 [Dictyocoela muelleri]|nr:hypothetical protein DMUE_4417 [Dictyocoela muelleri]